MSSLIVMSTLVLLSCVQAQDVIDKVDETYNNVTAVEVEGSFCSVNIVGGNGNDVHFTGEVIGSNKYDIKIRHNMSGGTLRVWIDRPNSLRNVKGKLEFSVPSNTNIDVDNSSGSVSVSDIGQVVVKLEASSGSVRAMNIDSNITAQASSGSISLSDISGDARATTSSGSQRHEGIGGSLKAKASSGSIKVNEVKGEAEVTTSSGSQSIHTIGSNLYAQASSGSIKINDVRGDVRGATSSGGMSLNGVTGALNLSTTSGSQRGTNIKLTGNSNFKSSSGSVSMDLTNDTEELSFALKASSGSLNAKGSSGRKNLVIDRGPIKITGNSSSGSQSYR
ncbi:DUF4097 family beta strand repeat protein [Carboxylicivirga sp. A043]|uniref:DUF4097 domain-containing protein n=1 Tax=Carboxylicivirga litoralis TaxID=2816963 RepID=UPI0021CB40B5|nr:DUF4097 domain-containing protein [Carboxylicivirga sp. A043]MCU4155151.1 DUF4097 family beta strand repeat protein [Carboxylicivirga sp. A043]